MPLRRRLKNYGSAGERMMIMMQSLAFALVSFSSIVVLLLGVFLYTPGQVLRLDVLRFPYLMGLCASHSDSLHPLLPHSGSWNTWFHPQRSAVPHPNSSRNRESGWNLLYHLGGYGPWVEKVDGISAVSKNTLAPPVGCVVDQIHVVRPSSD